MSKSPQTAKAISSALDAIFLDFDNAAARSDSKTSSSLLLFANREGAFTINDDRMAKPSSAHAQMAQIAEIARIKENSGPAILTLLRDAFGARQIGLMINGEGKAYLSLDKSVVLSATRTTWKKHIGPVLRDYPRIETAAQPFLLDFQSIEEPVQKVFRTERDSNELSRFRSDIIYAPDLAGAIRQDALLSANLGERTSPRIINPAAAARLAVCNGAVESARDVENEIVNVNAALAEAWADLFEMTKPDLPAGGRIFIQVTSCGTDSHSSPLVFATPAEKQEQQTLLAELVMRVEKIAAPIIEAAEGHKAIVSVSISRYRSDASVIIDDDSISTPEEILWLKNTLEPGSEVRPFILKMNDERCQLILARGPAQAVIKYQKSGRSHLGTVSAVYAPDPISKIEIDAAMTSVRSPKSASK